MVIIDVRTPEEYNQEHANDAVNFPLQDLMDGQVPEYVRSTEIGLYCRSGARSAVAEELMKKMGFTNVKNLGGIQDVIDNNY